MAHVEPAHLVELSLGNAASSDADVSALQHLAACARCRDELRALTRMVAAARGTGTADPAAAPPERVWRRILLELSQEAEAPSPRAGITALRPPAAAAPRAGRARFAAGAPAGRLVLGALAGAALVWWAARGRSPRAPLPRAGVHGNVLRGP
ncbi:hypothetical protein ACIF8T_31720 [Streptomyces sp. NPDC085946]|uniref:hypothetical protein n=1 Tax=Streptomyces sp. NPDC085946 TaxID=3365744 RepID=UPI0037D8B0D6